MVDHSTDKAKVNSFLFFLHCEHCFLISFAQTNKRPPNNQTNLTIRCFICHASKSTLDWIRLRYEHIFLIFHVISHLINKLRTQVVILGSFSNYDRRGKGGVKKQRFDGQNARALHVCICFSTFLCRTLQTRDVNRLIDEWVNGKQEHATVNFPFSTCTSAPCLRIQLSDISATLDKVIELK